MKLFLPAIFAAIAIPSLADALSFTASANAEALRFRDGVLAATIACDGPQTGQAGATSTCTADGVVTSSASGGNGFLRATARVDWKADSVDRLPGALRTSSARVSFFDSIMFDGVDDGQLLLGLDFLGALSVTDTIGGFVGIGNGQTSATINFGLNYRDATSLKSFGVNSSKIISLDENANDTVISVGETDVVDSVSILIRNGQAIFDGVLEATASCTSPGVSVGGGGDSCSSSANFGSSLRFIGASVFDNQGLDVTNLVTATSVSGFDYLKGVAPHERISAVPLPAGFPLFLTALFLLGLIKRRKTVAA